MWQRRARALHGPLSSMARPTSGDACGSGASGGGWWRSRPPPRAAADVGRRVREWRERRGMSLSELARRAVVGKATLSGLEAGTRNPTLDTLQAVAAALDLPLTTLLSPEPATLRGAAVQVQLLRVF